MARSDIECPEAVTLYGNLNNWHDAIGTGPFILTDFVDNSEATMIKNPNYWGYDERYPAKPTALCGFTQVLIITNNIYSTRSDARRQN